MLNFCSLYSGSSGNSLFVETENTKILVDVGLSCKKIEEALASIEKDLSSIDAILITHEHSDHIKGLSTISKKFDIPVLQQGKPLMLYLIIQKKFQVKIFIIFIQMNILKLMI